MFKESTSKGKFFMGLLKLVVLVLFVGSVAGCVYFYFQYKKLTSFPDVQVQQENDRVLSELSKVMLIPSGENPIFAKVLDKSKLKDQPFFQKAENGDSLVIFPSLSEAVLYRSSINKIIGVAPLAVDPNATQQTQDATVGAKAKTKTAVQPVAPATK